MRTRRHLFFDMGASLAAMGLLPLARPRSLRRQTAHGTGLVYDDRFLEHVLPMRRGEIHPERPLRLKRIIREAFAARGLDQELVPVAPLGDPMPHVQGHHTAEHVAAVRQIEVTGPVAALAVAGALGAVDAGARRQVRNVFCCMRPPGHHANNTGREEGFCFYSNAAIAAKYAQQAHGYQRILIVDWDYHHGNATQNAFPGSSWRSQLASMSASLQPHSRCTLMLRPLASPVPASEGSPVPGYACQSCVEKNRTLGSSWVTEFRPDFIVVSAGFDSRKDDLLGCFEVTDDAFRAMTRTVMDIADDFCDGRVVSILEGGYNVDGTALAAAAHVETLLEHRAAANR